MTSADLSREAQDPSTGAARLAELAQLDCGLWTVIAVHPAAYPALLEWLGQQGDPVVDAVLALRTSAAATPQPAHQPISSPPPPTAADVTPLPTAPAAAAAQSSSTTKNPLLVAAAAVVVLLLVGGAAFGATKIFGGDDEEDEPTASQTIDAPEPITTPTVGGSLDTAGGDDTAAKEFCSTVDRAHDAMVGGPGSVTAGSEAVKELAEILSAAEALAPTAVKGDVRVMAEYFESVSDPSSIDSSTISERVQPFTAAGKRVSASTRPPAGSPSRRTPAMSLRSQ